MNEKIKHRGPDDEGIYIDDSVSLGHVRLSILDLSNAGHQPMFYNRELGACSEMYNKGYINNCDISIVFNGEIYNYLELRKILKKKGYVFATGTDTEVILASYLEWGENCVNKFNGMWAFCIYDRNKDILFCSRDRIGEKPFYYYFDGSRFIFSSELKGLLVHKIRRVISEKSLIRYLATRYIFTEETIFRNIRKLKPGHSLLFNFKKRKLVIRRYWDVKDFGNVNKTVLEIEEDILNLLRDSIKRRMIADVPLGSFLSSGLDSSVITTFAKNYSKKLNTYSIGFEDNSRFNELALAKETSDFLKTNHYSLVIPKSFLHKLPEVVYYLDEPMSDPASFAIFFLFRLAKRDVKVILTGDGADELFGGYSQYKFFLAGRFLSNLPSCMLDFVAFLFKNTPFFIKDKLYNYSSVTGKKLNERFYKFLKLIKKDPGEAFLEIVSIFDYEERNSLLDDRLRAYNYEIGGFVNKYFNSRDDLVNISNFDIENYLVDDLLMKSDKMGMANSIEVRLPFLDYRLVELSRSIPYNLKIKNFTAPKYILRHSLRKEVPNFILLRKKQPFQLPLHSWLVGDFKDIAYEYIIELSNKIGFNKKYVKRIFDRYSESPLFYGRQIWNLFTLSIWYKIYVEEVDFREIKFINHR